MPEQRAAPRRNPSLLFPLVALVVGTVVLVGLVWGTVELLDTVHLPFRS